MANITAKSGSGRVTANLDYTEPTVQPVQNQGRITDTLLALYGQVVSGTTWDSTTLFPNDIDVSAYEELIVYMQCTSFTGGTSPTLTVEIAQIFNDPAGTVKFDMADSTAVPVLTVKVFSVGPGCAFNSSIGKLIRVIAFAGGAPTGFTFSVVVLAKG